MMFTGILIFLAAALGIAAYIILRALKQAERQRYYDAACRILKEECLDQAIQSRGGETSGGQKTMLYLKWKDTEKHGYVFQLERPVYVGRDPQINQVCIREETVSAKHCVFYLYQGGVYLGDLNSRNGTWLRRGLRTRRVTGAVPVVSGDRLLIGGLSLRAEIFTMDMAYM